MLRKLLMTAILLGMSVSLLAGTSPTNLRGNLVEWVSMRNSDITINAAIGKNGTAVVIYNGAALASTPVPLLQFALLRQDVVAFLAAKYLYDSGQTNKLWGDVNLNGARQSGLPFSPIAEELVYSLPELGGLGPQAIDCIAFWSLEGSLKYAIGTMATSSGFVIPGSTRIIPQTAIPFFQGPACAGIVQNFTNLKNSTFR